MKARILSAALVATIASFSSTSVFAQSDGGVTPLDLVGSGETFSYVDSPGYTPTMEEGGFRGMAEFARGMGDFNYLSAEATKSHEQARSLNLDNRMKWLQHYWEAKRMNHENTLGQVKRFTTEQMAAIARKDAPPRLASHQYEPFNGRLVWPAALKTEQFAEHRAALNDLFAKRTTHDVGKESDFHLAVSELTNEMGQMLQQQIDQLSPQQYMVAKRFITGLEQESHLYPGTAGLASR